MKILIGAANSISFNQDYDPLDTLKFVQQTHFEMVQIYLNTNLLNNGEDLKKIKNFLNRSGQLPCYFHSEMPLNMKLVSSEYYQLLYNYLESFDYFRIIFHYDEKEKLENILQTIQKLHRPDGRIYLENDFQLAGKSNAEKNLRKFMAVFSLSQNSDYSFYPVIDIPRFFTKKLGFTSEESLNWCYQLFNFFNDLRVPVLLHMIDAKDANQQKNMYCPLGEGHIPYKKIFNFLKKNRVELIEGIIFEYLDKINTLKSRENLNAILADSR